MTTGILLFLSIVLNLVTIFAIIVLYLRQNRLLVLDHTQKQAMKEMEELFSVYIAELKEENEQFIDRLTRFQSQDYAKSALSHSSVEESSKVENEEKISSSYKRMYAAKTYQNTLQANNETEPERKEKVEKSLSEQVQSLKNKGLSIDEIAKTLNKGKTEIDLILKFLQKSKDKLD
ncbi:swarming motility protein SwrB [Heyndrickxia sporothermodurans]|nr:swarming motility protein SwrB [Heyndrickxia sporothermodurans]